MIIREILPDELEALLLSNEPYALLDIRERPAYNRGQILGSTNVPRYELEFRIPQLVPIQSTEIILYDDEGERAPLAAKSLEENGYSHTKVLKGGLNAWEKAGKPLVKGVNVPSKTFGEVVASQHSINQIAPAELHDQLKRGEAFIGIEVRPPEEVGHSGSIPGFINIQGVELPLVANDLAKQGKKIVVTCAGRTRGIIAATTLKMMGIDVLDLHNGTMGWVLSGFELESMIPAGPKPSVESKESAHNFAAQLVKDHGIRHLSVERLREMQQEESYLYVFDVRTKEEYESGHIPGTVSLPGGQAIQCADDFIAVRNSTIVFVCEDQVRSTLTAYWYLKMGFKNVYVLESGMGPWQESDLEKGVPTVVPIGLQKAAGKIIKVDAATLRNERSNRKIIYVGNSRDFKNGHIPGSVWLLRSLLEEKIGEIAITEDPIVLTCKDGNQAIFAAATLMELGYKRVQALEGGTDAWRSAGFALEKGSSGIIGEADDILPRSHERSRQQMIDYLNWEEKLHDDPLYTKILD
ncbi:rhodanese-like domain-containing protein [Ammoniphilus resinae]|uniref:Rhodanese-related sulfurtransferase n=1 Tax=Ammoniphilus resinae TaxID=861532 RepID=A0ABS4GVQ7_9BACL|nr:rhodanese-like domain-containing protein [Ammoniphilus resinae]MBP1934351.1 rhodanese-related sulfurtransferase [Ammoniphilus resinae]